MESEEYLTVWYLKKTEAEGHRPSVQAFFPARYRNGKKSTRTELYRRVRTRYVLKQDDTGAHHLYCKFKETRTLNTMASATTGVFP